MKDPFQPSDRPWGQYARLGGLQSVIDPQDDIGLKNAYIDDLHKAGVEEVARLTRNLTVLDYGCGNGRMARFLAPRVRRVIGVDITKAMLDAAREGGGQGAINYIQINGRDLPLGTGSVDLILSVYVLQYFVKKVSLYQHVLREFARVLNRSGRLIFIEQASETRAKSGSVSEDVAMCDYLKFGESAPFQVLEKRVLRLGGRHGWSGTPFFEGGSPDGCALPFFGIFWGGTVVLTGKLSLVRIT